MVWWDGDGLWGNASVAESIDVASVIWITFLQSFTWLMFWRIRSTSYNLRRPWTKEEDARLIAVVTALQNAGRIWWRKGKSYIQNALHIEIGGQGRGGLVNMQLRALF